MRDAVATWEHQLGEASGNPDRLAEQWTSFAATLARHAAALDPAGESDSTVLRALLEAFVAATAKAADDARYVDAYAEWRRQDAEAADVRTGALEASADRWKDD